MVYATWIDELDAFESECDRLRKSRRESFPVKLLGFAPLASLPFLGGVGVGRRLVAGVGIITSGISLLLELDKQREAYGGNLTVDLNPNSDYDNLAGAFRTRSPRWEALSYLYSQLDPITVRDRLSHLDNDTAKKTLDRMVNRVRRGLNEIRDIPSSTAGYADVVWEITSEWRDQVGGMLDRALFKAGVIDAEDLQADPDLDEEGAIAPAADSASSEEPTTTTLELFDWSELNRYPNRFPHLLLLGKTGAGKTTLAEKLLELLPGDRLVITPHYAPSDFPGVQVIGAGRNYAAILMGLQGLEKEMQSRYQRYAKGQTDFNWLNVCIDEFPAIAANCGKDASELMMVLAREARKVKIRLIILSQGGEVKALGIEGNGSVRECFTFIRLRGFAEDHAKRLKDGAIAQTIAQQPYPCLVEDIPADTSVLTVLSMPVEPSNSKGSTPIQDMGAWLDDEEDEGDEFDDAFYIPRLPGVALSGEGQRLYKWLLRKREQHPDGLSFRDLCQGKPLGKAIKHNAETLQPVLSELLGQSLITWDEESGAIAIG